MIFKKQDFSTFDQGVLLPRSFAWTDLPVASQKRLPQNIATLHPTKLNKIQLSVKRRNLLCDANFFAPVVKTWLKFHRTMRYRGRDVEYESSFTNATFMSVLNILSDPIINQAIGSSVQINRSLQLVFISLPPNQHKISKISHFRQTFHTKSGNSTFSS